MSTIAIGDVHGNRQALDDLLNKVLAALSPLDTVVFLGDYIDRGPDSKGCIDSILRFLDQSPARVVTLAGNHEDWLLRTFHDFRSHSWLLGMDAFPTIQTYSAPAAAGLRRAAGDAGPRLITERVPLPYELFFEAMPPGHLAFLQGLRLYHQTADALFVHGGLDPAAGPVHRQPAEALLWGTDRFFSDYTGPDLVGYGHWNNAALNPQGWPGPAFQQASAGIDTISHGVLTALRLPSRSVLQSARYAASRQ